MIKNTNYFHSLSLFRHTSADPIFVSPSAKSHTSAYYVVYGQTAVLGCFPPPPNVMIKFEYSLRWARAHTTLTAFKTFMFYKRL